jgi:hypothetical protein
MHYNCEDDKDPNEEQNRNEGIRLDMLSTKLMETIATSMFMNYRVFEMFILSTSTSIYRLPHNCENDNDLIGEQPS